MTDCIPVEHEGCEIQPRVRCRQTDRLEDIVAARRHTYGDQRDRFTPVFSSESSGLDGVLQHQQK